MRYRKFITSDEKIISKNFQTVITKLPDGSKRERIFYPEKYQCTNEITYYAENPTVKNGSYKEWWDNGYQKIVGQYDMGLKTGIWKSYSQYTGDLSTEVNYINDKKNGVEKDYSKEGFLSSNYTYQMGIKEGAFTTFDSLGILQNEGVFKSDTIFSQIKKQVKKKFTGVEQMPKFPGCESISSEGESKACAQRKMLAFIYSDIRYPADARERGIEGTAIIRYVIDRDGSIIKVETVRGISQTIEAECLRLVNSMPDWNPGYQDGKPVKVQYNLPIKFKLQ